MATKRRTGKAIVASTAMHEDWQARDDMHTLKRAAEINGDAKRFKAAQAQIRREMKELKKTLGDTDD